MQCFFTGFIAKENNGQEHEVEQRKDIDAVDIVEGNFVVRVRPDGIIIMREDTVIFDKRLEEM